MRALPAIAQGAAYWDQLNLDWFFIVHADSPALGEQKRYYATRQITLDGIVFQDLLQDFSFGGSELPLKGGLAPVADFDFTLLNLEGMAQQLLKDYFLENDPVEAFVALSQPGDTLTWADLIPIGQGALEGHPHTTEQWRIRVVDDSERIWTPIPQQRIWLGVGQTFRDAPLEEQGKPLPMPFGYMNRGPYDDQGTKRFLAPCRCTNTLSALTFTPGLYCYDYGTPFQKYPQAGDRLAQILNFTQDGPYVTIHDPTRLLILRPVRPETIGEPNTVTDWYLTGDGQSSTGVHLEAGDVLSVYFAGVPKLGSLYQAEIAVLGTGSWDYALTLGNTLLDSGSGSGVINLDEGVWAQDWNFEVLRLKLTSADAQVNELQLKLYFNDQTAIDIQTGLEVYQKVIGLYDDATFYVDGGLITGVANTILTNPVDILQAIARHKNLLGRSITTIHTESFATARPLREGDYGTWNFAFSLYELVKDIRWLDPFLQEAGLHLFENAEGKLTVVARQLEVDTPQHLLLSGWNVCVQDARRPIPEWQEGVEVDRLPSRDLLNDFVVQGQLDRTTGVHNALEALSSAYRLTGTCSVDAETEQAHAPGQTFLTDGIENGFALYLENDQAYTVTVLGQEDLQLHTLQAEDEIEALTDVTFWIGPHLDPDVLRSRRRHKTHNPWGRAQDPENPADLGGYQSAFAGDLPTVALIARHQRDWHAHLPELVQELSVMPSSIALEQGDRVVFHDPELPADKQAETITSLASTLVPGSTQLHLVDAEAVQEGDILLLNAGKPEALIALEDGDYDTGLVTVQRAQLNTLEQTHPAGTALIPARCGYRSPLPANALRRSVGYAARGITAIMPSSGLCRLDSPFARESSRSYAA